MEQVIELLGKTVKFVHTENGHFFEEQGKVTEVLLSLSGENRIALDEQELYLLSDLLELEVLWKPCYTSVTWVFVNIPRESVLTRANSAGVVVETPSPSLQLAFVSHSLILTDLGQKGACNQGKRCFRSVLRQFGGNSAPSVNPWEIASRKSKDNPPKPP